jgi:putative aldouronate transport system substrate-binding protein
MQRAWQTLVACATGLVLLSPWAVAAEPLDLTIHMHFRDKYTWREDWPVARELTRLTGVRLRNVASTATASSREAFNLMLVSGKLPDIVGGDNLKGQFIRYGLEGAFVALNDLIDNHAPHLKAYLAANPEVRRAITAPDGKIYYIPYLPDGTFARGWFIRQDWLDKLGLQVPGNVDELYAVLKAFRDRDPNGNGRRDEVPFFVREAPELGRLFNLWDARSTGSEAAHDFYVEGGQVRHPYAEPNYRTAIRNVAKWYAEGLIDREVFTRGSRARDVLLGNNLGGMTHDWFASTAGYNTVLAARVPGLKFVAFPPPASVSGKRIEENRRARVRPDGWAITSVNKHAIETIKLFDFYFSPEGKRLSNFGIEGQHYEMAGGVPRFKPEVLNAKKAVNTQMWEIGAQIPLGFVQDYAYEAQWTEPIASEGIALYEKGNYLIDEFPGVSLAADERRKVDRKWPSILNVMLEHQQAWILGARNVDADWEGYLAGLKRLGLDGVIASMQKAYDRQYLK